MSLEEVTTELESDNDLEKPGNLDRVYPDEFKNDTYQAPASEEFVRQAMSSPEAETLEGSLTNEVAISPVGTVIKEFSHRPTMAYVQMLGRIPAGKLEYQDWESRVENERTFREFAEDIDVRLPEILGSEENYVEFERIDGADLNTYLNNASKGEAYGAGHLVGDFVKDIHDRGGALTDLRINNFLMDEDSELGFVDAEYFSEDATNWEQKMDMITMVSSAKQVESDAYKPFREGFEKQYGQDIDIYESAISSITAPGHASMLERDSQRLRNAISNISLGI